MISTSFTDHMTTGQAARLLGLSPDRIRQLVRSGQLVSIPTPLGVLITRDALDRLIAKRRSNADAHNA